MNGGSYSTYAYGGGSPVNNIDPSGNLVFPLPPPVAAPVAVGTIAAPIAAVAEAGIAGYAFGTAIYDSYGSQIDNEVSGVLGQIDWIYQQAIEYGANHEEVHRICDEPTPPFKDPCERAKWELKKALSCKAVREAHNTKWFGGVYDQAHADHMQQVDNQIARAIRAVKNSCKPGCGSK